MAIKEVVKEAMWLKGFIGEIYLKHYPISLFSNEQSVIYLSNDQMFNGGKKHIDIHYHFVQEVFMKINECILRINTRDNPVENMTKPVPRVKFMHCLSLIGPPAI